MLSYVKVHLLQWLMALAASFAPLQAAATAAVFFPVADMVLALSVAYRKTQPVGLRAMLALVRSSGMRRMLAKVAMYLAALVAGFSAETFLGVPYATRVISVWIGSTELKSCLEHLDAISGTPVLQEALRRLAPPNDSKEREDKC
jgi:hypothetical protein